MANVNLKTDFKDGEFLYADQLKNNFEAIQAALNAMNAIVWQDNADKVVTFRGTTEELMNREIIDGQILYDTTTGESYIDYLGRRISTGSGNAIHIGDTEPTNPSTQIWIDKDDLSAVGSEVVNSLEGNEERMAPSVAAVKKLNTNVTFTNPNQNIPDKTFTNIIYGTKPANDFIEQSTDGTFNFKKTGTYLIVLNTGFTSSSGKKSVGILYKGRGFGEQNMYMPTNSIIYISSSCLLNVNQNDTFIIRAFHDNGADVALRNDSSIDIVKIK